jgi:hypothetical protein
LGGGVILVNYTTDNYGNYEIDIARSTNHGSSGSTIRLTGVVSTVAYFYKDGSTVYLLDNGATWTSLGNAVSFNPGSFI